MEKLNNWFLRPIEDGIQVLPGKVNENLFAWMSKHGVPRGKGTIVEWSGTAHHSIEFDYAGCENEISDALRSSPIVTSPRITVFCFMSNPLMSLTSRDFADHWHAFWAASAYMELLAISDDGKHIVEMTEHPLLLHSNFRIR